MKRKDKKQRKARKEQGGTTTKERTRLEKTKTKENENRSKREEETKNQVKHEKKTNTETDKERKTDGETRRTLQVPFKLELLDFEFSRILQVGVVRFSFRFYAGPLATWGRPGVFQRDHWQPGGVQGEARGTTGNLGGSGGPQ